MSVQWNLDENVSDTVLFVGGVLGKTENQGTETDSRILFFYIASFFFPFSAF